MLTWEQRFARLVSDFAQLRQDFKRLEQYVHTGEGMQDHVNDRVSARLGQLEGRHRAE